MESDTPRKLTAFDRACLAVPLIAGLAYCLNWLSSV
jgi:hypothetical protein